MSEDAGLDDPGDGNFAPVLKAVSLSQHEHFEKSQGEFIIMGKNKRARQRARERDENTVRSRSRSPALGRPSMEVPDIDSQASSQLSASSFPLGQQSIGPTTSPSAPSTPPQHLILDTQSVKDSQNISQTPVSLLTPIGRETYNKSDQGPYVVHVQRVESAPDSGATLHPVALGLFLQNRKREFPNIIDGSVKRIGRNRVSICFHTGDDANKFLSSPTLSQHKYTAFIPSFNVTRLGLVRGVPADWSPEDIMGNLELPSSCGGARPIKIRRLNFKKSSSDGSYSWMPSETIVITFDGQVLPQRVFLCLNSLPVEQYQFPTVQCYRCCRFGHTKDKCRSLPRCFRCGGPHTGDTCDTDSHEAHCCNCPQGMGHGHFANSKVCPEFNRQTAIKKSMANENISYVEASKLHARITQRSYSNVASSTSHSYKKTVFRNPRSPPTLTKGYDRKAHEEIVRDPVVSSRPVIADVPHSQPQQTENLIRELIKILSSVVKVFSPSSPLADSSLLSHVAPFISSLLFSSNNGPNSPSMELP